MSEIRTVFKNPGFYYIHELCEPRGPHNGTALLAHIQQYVGKGKLDSISVMVAYCGATDDLPSYWTVT